MNYIYTIATRIIEIKAKLDVLAAVCSRVYYLLYEYTRRYSYDFTKFLLTFQKKRLNFKSYIGFTIMCIIMYVYR